MWTATGWYEDAKRHAAGHREQIRNMAEHRLRTYAEKMSGKSRAEIAGILAAFNRQRLSAAPDPVHYPELRGMPELVEADWRGTRDGAGLTDEQWAASCDSFFYLHRFLASGRKPPAGWVAL